MIASTCQDVVDLITAYFEEALPAAQRLDFERHVALCPPCRAYMSQMRGVLRLAGSLREEELPEDVRAKLVDAFADWREQRTS